MSISQRAATRIKNYLEERNHVIHELDYQYFTLVIAGAVKLARLSEKEILILWSDGELTEGEVCQHLNIDRLQARELAQKAGLKVG